MSYRDLTEREYAKRQARIDELMKRQKYLQDSDDVFVGAKIWLAELDELEEVIAKGLESNWLYGENNYVFE
jgi:hypothetical protein